MVFYLGKKKLKLFFNRILEKIKNAEKNQKIEKWKSKIVGKIFAFHDPSRSLR